jgi:hypothetical protein
MTPPRRRNVKVSPGWKAAGDDGVRVMTMSAAMKRVSLLIVTAASIPIVPATGQADAAVVSFTQDFNSIDLDFTRYAAPGYTTSISFSDGSGRAVRFETAKSSAIAESARLHAISQSFLFDPATQGSITSIDASIAMSNYIYTDGTALSFASFPNRLRLLAKQDGKVYEATYDAPGPVGSYGVYQTAAHSGFTANDFLLFDPANPNAVRTLTGLDFAGSTIAFGFELAAANAVLLSTGAPYPGNTASVIDANAFSVSVNYRDTPSAVPEPTQWALMLTGFGLAGAMMRRGRLTPRPI